MKRVSLELGGHAPFLIFDDADLDAAVKEVFASKFRNAGQTCVCANRIYVHAGIHDRVRRAASPRRAAGLRVGDPIDATDPSRAARRRARAWPRCARTCDDALGKGARAVVGGHGAETGCSSIPTVLTSVSRRHADPRGRDLRPGGADRAASPTKPRPSAQANDTPFGLAAYLWTRDLSRAFRVAEALDYGIVGVNDGVPSTPQAPFGGMKMPRGWGAKGGCGASRSTWT